MKTIAERRQRILNRYLQAMIDLKKLQDECEHTFAEETVHFNMEKTWADFVCEDCGLEFTKELK